MDEPIIYEEYKTYKAKKPQRIKNGWGYRVTLFLKDGTTKTIQDAGYKEKKDANKARDIAIGQLESKTYLTYGNMLAKKYFEHWLEGYIRQVKKNYNTYYSYKSKIDKYINPLIGNKRMCELNTGDVVRLYNRVYGISKSNARIVKAIVHSCFEQAVKEKAMRVNVAHGVLLPRSENTTPYRIRAINVEKTLNEEQIMKLIDGCKGTKIYIMVLFAVIMGLRCSEIIGLRYDDIDFMERTITIRRQLGRDLSISRVEAQPKTYTKQEIPLKTESSYRTIAIPDIVFEAILQERAKYEKNRNRRKNAFQDLGYICCSSYGRPRSKNFHFQIYKGLLRDLELPNIRWHDLRATAATMILRNFENPKVASRTLGHEHEILTINTYGDNIRLAQIDMGRINDFIDEVTPKDINKEIDASNILISVDEYVKKANI